MDRAEYLERWSALHGGAPTTGLIGGWLVLAHALARPLVRLRVGPGGVTLLGLATACAALLPAAAGGRWALAVVALVAVAAVLDSLDGAVAVMTGRVTGWGALLDAICDRVADAAFVGCLWLLGAPGVLVVAGGAVAWLHEYLRARATAVGMAEVAVISVSERPTRVVVTVMFALGCGLYPSDGTGWATAGAATWAILGVIGLAQVALAARHLLEPPSSGM